MLRHGEVMDQELGSLDSFMNSVSRDMLCSDMVVLLTTGRPDTVCTAYCASPGSSVGNEYEA
jgi:hypothetical protein